MTASSVAKRDYVAARGAAVRRRHFDWGLLLATAALMALGLVMIYSATRNVEIETGSWWDRSVFRQGVYAIVGLLLSLGFAAMDYHWWLAWARWLYVVVLLVLGMTSVLGKTSFGARSWLQFRYFDVQPSELVKLFMVVINARLLGRDRESLESPRPLLLSVLALVPPVVLIYLQPDFGMALVIVAVWIGMVFSAGVRWRHLLLILVFAGIAAPIIWFRLEDYMRVRILTFFFPEQDPSGASYNINQALISIGSGGWWGKGLFRGTQTQLHFLRVRHTDFIFSVLAEELGFIGAILLLALYSILLLRLVRIADTAPDDAGRLIAAGVACAIFVQAFINLAMNVNLLPVTGLPLPLVSYGGSSLLTTSVGLGLAHSVASRSGRETWL